VHGEQVPSPARSAAQSGHARARAHQATSMLLRRNQSVNRAPISLHANSDSPCWVSLNARARARARSDHQSVFRQG
jgi:hypothetical protein